jgi:hypothetical protein
MSSALKRLRLPAETSIVWSLVCADDFNRT